MKRHLFAVLAVTIAVTGLLALGAGSAGATCGHPYSPSWCTTTTTTPGSIPPRTITVPPTTAPQTTSTASTTVPSTTSTTTTPTSTTEPPAATTSTTVPSEVSENPPSITRTPDEFTGTPPQTQRREGEPIEFIG